MIMSAFYQVDRWLHLKRKILDQPAYRQEFFDILSKPKFNRVLDCGCGAGDFVKVMMEKGISFKEMVGFDIDAQLIDIANRNFSDYPNIDFQVHNIYDLESNRPFHDFDLVTAQALLEHTNMSKAIPILRSFIKPGGYMYFPHNYMTPTMFLPVFDNSIDRAIIQNFDRFSIENQVFEGEVCGDSRCGAKLFNIFKEMGFEVLHFATSDWMLYPKVHGYTDEEKEILYMLLDFFYDANKEPRIPMSRRIDNKILENWRVERFRQIEENLLVYICPQTSILVRNPG